MSPTMITLIILAITIILFVWGKVSECAISVCIVLALILTGVLDAAAAFSTFVNTNVIMIFATLVIGGALFETGMAEIIARTVSKFTKNERTTITAIFTISALMSSLLSNTGTSACLFPIVIGIAAATGFKRSRVLMPIIIGATAGSLGTIMGTPSILTTSAFLEDLTGNSFNFFSTSPIGILFMIVGIVFFYFIGWKMMPVRETEEEIEHESKKFDNVPKWKQWASLAMLFLVIIGMIFEKKIGVKMYITCTLGAVLLVLSNVITEKQAFQMVSWKTIYVTAGMLTLASAMNSSGAGQAIADVFIRVFGTSSSPWVLTAGLYIIANLLTQLMSNAACIAMLLPVAGSIATGLGADPTAVLMATLCGASMAFCTPMAQPMNTMIYGPGGYKFTDYFKAGWMLTLIYAILGIILLPVFYPFY